MKNSHTLLLIDEAFDKIQEFNYKKYTEELNKLVPQKARARKHPVNEVLERFGLHLIRKELLDELENNLYSKMGKWSSVGMLKCALEDSDKFDKVYDLFTEEESKSTFDWFVQFRVGYAFLGEAARFIFPPAISHEVFIDKLSSIKLDRSGFVNIGGYKFISHHLEVAGSWVFEQYNLKGLCEVSLGDFVVDGGAFEGETSFWFLSKGAHRVYAFEGDDMNFKVLSKNIELNKVEDKIIPVKALLSDKDGISKIKMIGSGSSSTLANEGTEVECVALDSFATKNNIERIDFIKLDVEGAESDVLEGAAETIKKNKPKMAISVYHKPDDIAIIPLFLKDLLPEAKFYMRHFSDGISETVLFVNPR